MCNSDITRRLCTRAWSSRSSPPPRPRSFCARAPCGSRLFEIELKVALAEKESVIAKKNEIVATARADTARARTALRMAIRRQAAWRAARAATVQRLAGIVF